MGLFGAPKEYCRQLFFRDDWSFTIRRLPIENTFVVEKYHDEVKSAWLLPYRVLKKFSGYKSARPAMVLISFGRDILLDKFNQLKDEEKPEKGRQLVKKMISDVATRMLYHHGQGKKKSVLEKMVVYVGATMILLGLVVAIVAINRGGA